MTCFGLFVSSAIPKRRYVAASRTNRIVKAIFLRIRAGLIWEKCR